MRNATQKNNAGTGTHLVTITAEIQSEGKSLAQAAVREATAFDHLAGMLYIIDIAMTDSMNSSSREFNDHLANAIRACQKLVDGERANGTGYVVHDFISSLLNQTDDDASLQRVA